MWQGWDPEDQQAVEDAERFDDITIGFMDEEHETMRETAVKKSLGRKRRGKRVCTRMAVEVRQAEAAPVCMASQGTVRGNVPPAALSYGM